MRGKYIRYLVKAVSLFHEKKHYFFIDLKTRVSGGSMIQQGVCTVLYI